MCLCRCLLKAKQSFKKQENFIEAKTRILNWIRNINVPLWQWMLGNFLADEGKTQYYLSCISFMRNICIMSSSRGNYSASMWYIVCDSSERWSKTKTISVTRTRKRHFYNPQRRKRSWEIWASKNILKWRVQREAVINMRQWVTEYELDRIVRW